MAYTTANLLDAIKRRSFMPTGSTTFTNAELLAMADEELKSLILPNILAVREEFFVHYKDFSIAAGTAGYAIPSRSIGMIVREVQIVDGNDNVTDLPRMEPEQIASYASGTPNAFYLKNNKVMLYPKPSSSTGTLKVYYFLRPGNLIETTASAVISSINTGTNVVSVSTIPSTWSTGDTFDFVKDEGGQEYVDIDYTSTLVSGTDITFSTLPDGLAVGDYICIAGNSPLVQLPPDYQPILAQAVAAQVLDNTSQPGASKAMEKTAKMLEAAQALITPRVEGADRIILHNWF